MGLKGKNMSKSYLDNFKDALAALNHEIQGARYLHFCHFGYLDAHYKVKFLP